MSRFETHGAKLAPKSEMMTYLGNAKGASGFTFMRSPNNVLFYAAQCIFDEDLFPKCQTGPRQPLMWLHSNVLHKTHLHHEDTILVDEEVPSPLLRIKQKQPEQRLPQQAEQSPSPVAPPHEATPPIPGGLPPSREPSPEQRAPSPVLPEAPLERQRRTKKVPLQPGNVYGERRHPVDILKPRNKRNWKKLEKAAKKPRENASRSSSPVPGPSNQPQTDVEDVPLPSISPTPSELEVEGGLDYATDDPVVDRVCREGGVRLLSFLMALSERVFVVPFFNLTYTKLHTRSTYILPLHDLCPHQDQEKTMSSTAKNAILLQNRAANKVYKSTLFPSKSKSSPSSTPYPASTTSSTRLATSSS